LVTKEGVKFYLTLDHDKMLNRIAPNVVQIPSGGSIYYLSKENAKYCDLKAIFPIEGMSSFSIRAESASEVVFDFTCFELVTTYMNGVILSKEIRIKAKDENVTIAKIHDLTRQINRTSDLSAYDSLVVSYQRMLVTYIAKNGIPTASKDLWLAQENDCSATPWYCDIMSNFVARRIPVKWENT